MAEQFGTNMTLSEGTPLSPLVGPSVIEMLTERVKELCAQLDAKEDENSQLRKENQRLKNALFEEQLKKAMAYENIAQLTKQMTPTKAPVIDLTPLHSPEAKALVARLQEGGLLDENFQPTPDLSGAQKGLLANYMATRLNISNVWQFFGGLWHIASGTLRTAYNKALEQRNTLDFQDRLKTIIDT